MQFSSCGLFYGIPGNVICSNVPLLDLITLLQLFGMKGTFSVFFSFEEWKNVF